VNEEEEKEEEKEGFTAKAPRCQGKMRGECWKAEMEMKRKSWRGDFG